MSIRKKDEPVYRAPFNEYDMCEIGDFARWLGPGYHKDVPAWYLKDTGKRGKPERVVVTRIRGPLDRERSGIDYAELKNGKTVPSTYLFPSKGYLKPRFVLLQDNFGLAHNWVAFRRGAKLKPVPEDEIVEGATTVNKTAKKAVKTLKILGYSRLSQKVAQVVEALRPFSYRNIKRSKGHIAFVGDFEFYLQNGEIIKAPLHNAFDLDGYRHGRWEGPERMVKDLVGLTIERAKMIGKPYEVEKKWAKKLGV